MEYPGSKISKKIRYAILFTAIAIFFIMAPALIMYTSGYRYDWKRGFLRETGALNIDIEPKNAGVTINGVKMKPGMPLRLTDRIPGKYKILISAPGYIDWQKEIEIKNKQTLYIKDVSLLKSNQPSLIAEGNVNDVKISFDGKYLSYLRTTETNIEAHLVTLDSFSDLTLLVLPKSTGAKIEMSPNNHYIAISEAQSPYNTLTIFNSEDVSKKIDLIARTKVSITKYQWKESSAAELYYSTKSSLMSIIPLTEQRYLLSKNTWFDWYMENGQLWTLQLSSTTKKIKLVRDSLGFNEDFAAENIFTPSEQQLSILIATNNHLLFKKNNQPEMILLAKDKKYNLAGEKFKISPYNNWWLIWTPWEIWTYSMGKEPNLLNRSGEGLNNIEPLDQYNTLALIWNDKLTILYPYYLVTHDLINHQINSMAADSKNKILYFSGTINNKSGLWKLDY